MHSSIRIVSLIVFATALTRSHWLEIAVAAMVLLLLYARHPAYLKKAVFMSYKLKWFFISILLVYSLFFPVDAQTAWLQALSRISILVIMVFAVNLLLSLTSRQALIEGIYYLSQPLWLVGVDPRRLAARIVLSMEYVEQILQNKPSLASTGSPLQRLAESGALWVRRIEEKSQGSHEEQLDLPLVHPPAWQWIWPLVIALIFYFL